MRNEYTFPSTKPTKQLQKDTILLVHQKGQPDTSGMSLEANKKAKNNRYLQGQHTVKVKYVFSMYKWPKR